MDAGLSEIRSGMRAVIMQVCARSVAERQFRQIGLVPGTVVYCCYRSPGGSVVVLKFRDKTMALRTKNLRKIRIACIM